MARCSAIVAIATLLGSFLMVSSAPVAVAESAHCRQDVGSGSFRNLELLCRVPATRHEWDADGNLVRDPTTGAPVTTESQVTAINFIEYGRTGNAPTTASPRDVMFITGRFGLKSFDITDPANPRLLDWLGDGINDPILVSANAFGLLDDFWQNEDMDVDPLRKLVILSRDPRAYGGTTETGESGVYIVDAAKPDALRVLSYVAVPAGHTTTCINKCTWLWSGGPAKADSQPADWGGRPIFVTDIRDPKRPKTHAQPIDLGRNDGQTDYSHDVQVDDQGIAWVSGRGGTRGYWTSGTRFDPLLGRWRAASPLNPVPYAGGGIEESAAPSRLLHNAERPFGKDAPDPGYGDLIYLTEENFFLGCEDDGAFVVASLEGSYNGEGWRSTPTAPFRLRTVATWKPAAKEGSSTSNDCSAHYFDIENRLVAYSFYGQGVRLLDISDPTNPIQVGYFRPDGGTSWAAYWHKGLIYTADETGVFILRPQVAAGQVSAEVIAPAVARAGDGAAVVPVVDPLADPEAEQRRSFFCGVPPKA